MQRMAAALSCGPAAGHATRAQRSADPHADGVPASPCPPPTPLERSKLYWDELVGRAKEEAYRAEKKVGGSQGQARWQLAGVGPPPGWPASCTCYAPTHPSLTESRVAAPCVRHILTRYVCVRPHTLQARRAKDDFLHMLKHMRGIAVDTTWEAAGARAC